MESAGYATLTRPTRYFAAVAASGAVFFGVALLRFRRMVTLMQS
ncbi:MAG: hypothetical protein WAV07_18230 [Candidatus Contendobacter sp.]